MAPSSKRTPGLVPVVAVGVVLAMMMALPRFARAADLGDEPSSKSDSSSAQGEDNEKPKDSILQKKPADAAVASKKTEASGPPFYENWKFWAVAGGVVAAGLIAIFVVPSIAHGINGGDVRPCNMTFVGCFGENQ